MRFACAKRILSISLHPGDMGLLSTGSSSGSSDPMMLRGSLSGLAEFRQKFIPWTDAKVSGYFNWLEEHRGKPGAIHSIWLSLLFIEKHAGYPAPVASTSVIEKTSDSILEGMDCAVLYDSRQASTLTFYELLDLEWLSSNADKPADCSGASGSTTRSTSGTRSRSSRRPPSSV